LSGHSTPRIADLHCDTVGLIQKGADIAAGTRGHVDIPRMRAGGVSLQVFAAFVPRETAENEAYTTAMAKLDAMEAVCARHPGDLVLVEDAEGARRAAREGRIGVMLAVENGYAIEDDLEKLAVLRRRGVRILTLVHAKNTNWVASCTDTNAPFDGLSAFGEQVVDAMEEMGVLVDVSHCNEAAFWKVAARARKPFIASHSNAWELCRFPRNLKDEQIRALADSGGIIGINFCPDFLELPHDGRRITAETVVRHIDHMVNLVGDEHIAFGSDFDGIPGTPEDVTGSDGYPVILGLLRSRGHSEQSIRRMCWGNVMRVLEELR
jgi:membrane dipeptidase